ncbi:MAG: LacI family transcriptional regulator [Ruminococcaceae bacterium]|nr:LacI family transcriptional regulator [Oscillospiraceae bacterium]
MKKVTLKDIAQELNVTIGTVSHVMNGRDDISEETREKVLKTAKKLGYIPNASATSLRSGKSKTIAAIVPDISNPHIAYQIKLIEDKMRLMQYTVLILNTNESEETERDAIITACSKSVDGILLCPSQHSTKNIEFLNGLHIPYVLIGRFFSEIDTDYVCGDDFKSGYILGEYLAGQGCKNPLYIGAYKYIESSGNRFQGIQKAFEEKGIHVSEAMFIEMEPKSNYVESVLQKILTDKIPFDSIIAFSDLIAFEIISRFKSHPIVSTVPVVGFDAINAHLYCPGVSISVGMTDGGWADKASSILYQKMNGSKEKFHEIIDVKLFEFK